MIPKYQIDMYLRLVDGYKRGEIMTISSSRRAGKSYLNQWFNENLCKEIMLDANKVNKYNFSRAKWHEVHMMFKSYAPIQERIDWCTENFGPQPNVPDAWTRWYLSGLTTLKFRDSKDYEWFTLRWS